MLPNIAKITLEIEASKVLCHFASRYRFAVEIPTMLGVMVERRRTWVVIISTYTADDLVIFLYLIVNGHLVRFCFGCSVSVEFQAAPTTTSNVRFVR